MTDSRKSARPGAFFLADSSPREPSGRAEDEHAMALLAYSHTPVEQRVYLAILMEASTTGKPSGVFSVRQLMVLTGLNSYSTVRRARAGLVSKLSIECHGMCGEDGEDAGVPSGCVYSVFTPHEIFARRRAAGLEPYPKDAQKYGANAAFTLAVERLVNHHNISRREAQVALACAEGLTNADIGEKLFISEQTVKFHLRHIFVKLGVKRRAELISRLLSETLPETSEHAKEWRAPGYPK